MSDPHTPNGPGKPPSSDADGERAEPEAYSRLVDVLRAEHSDEKLLVRGERLGNFEIDGLLARGGSATVYSARQVDLGGRPAAVKVFRAHGRTERDREVFRREARLLAGLDHPHLAVVHASGEERGLLWFAMRLETGRSLQDVFGRDDAPPPDSRLALRWGAQVASALGAIHTAGLVHRDVKPANIVLRPRADSNDDTHDAVLIDFGLARRLAPDADTVTVLDGATPSYAPPEQLLGGDVDARADVFSLCVTLHDLVAGRIGRRHGAAAAGLDPLSMLVPHVDPDLEAVLAMGADPDRSWRHTDGAALRADFDACMHGRPVTARRRRLAERLRRWTARHPRRLLGLLLLVLVLGAVARSASWLLEQRRLAGNLAVAARTGDMTTLARDLPLSAPLARWIFTNDEDAQRTWERLQASPSDDPLASIIAELRGPEGRMSRALRRAARTISKNPPAREPLLEAFLLAHLDGTAPSATDASRTSAANLLPVLALEQPDESEASCRSSETWREACHRVLNNASARDDARQAAISILAWRGTGDDIEKMLALARLLPPGNEERRLALNAVRGILGRAHFLEPEMRPDVNAAWLGLRPLAVEAWQDPEWGKATLPWDAAFSLHRALLETALASRRLAIQLDVTADMPPAWLAALANGEARCGDASLLLAAIGDGRIPGWLDDLERYADSQWIPDPDNELGWICGALGDARVTTSVRVRLPGLVRDDPDGFELARFDEGLKAGQRDARGEAGRDRPEPASTLGALTDAEAVTFDWPWQGDTTEPGAAVWSIGNLPVLTGWATGLDGEGVGAVLSDGGARYLAFRTPGASVLRLQFDVDRPVIDAEFVLRGQVSARWSLPDQGRCKFEVLLDGQRLVSDGAAPHVHVRDDTFTLPVHDLTPGPHALTVRLGDSSTAPFWLMSARILTTP